MRWGLKKRSCRPRFPIPGLLLDEGDDDDGGDRGDDEDQRDEAIDDGDCRRNTDVGDLEVVLDDDAGDSICLVFTTALRGMSLVSALESKIVTGLVSGVVVVSLGRGSRSENIFFT